MISTLSIKNYALIDDVKVDFQSGLTIITGETGAGKSILLGALGLLLGNRADLSSVKDDSRKCIIEAEFNLHKVSLTKIFKNLELDYDDQTIIRREILPGGRSRAFVNDSPVNLQQLQALGVHLIDIHSQYETLSLASEDFQLDVIDALAGNQELLVNYSEAFTRHNNLIRHLESLKSQKEAAAKELDYNSFLFEELHDAGLDSLDQDDLEATYETLNNSEEIEEKLAHIINLFSEDPYGTLESAKQARQALTDLRSYSPKFDDLWSRLNSVIIELEDIHVEVDRAAAAIESDPQKLSEINEKLQLLYKLQQKHQVSSVSELKELHTNLGSQIENTIGLDGEIESIENQLDKARKEVFELATNLSEKRATVIPKLKEQLEEFLVDLGLPNARFKFQLLPSNLLRKHGTDQLSLLFTANKGLDYGPIKKVASGGELSRIMLAVKAVLTKYKSLPTIIFDEIDTGTSGEVAHKMALIFSEMSRRMQLISITHLPQIAAKGDFHIKVFKVDELDRTVTNLKTLNRDERIVEIAQMIGGEALSDSALAHAKQLLN